METNRMELSMDELEMVNGGDAEKQAIVSGSMVTICGGYGAGAGFLAGGPVGAAIGGTARAAVGGIVYGLCYLFIGD